MTTVRDCMVACPIVVAPTATVGEAVERMRAEGRGPLCVVDGGRLVGIVTRSDLMGVLPPPPVSSGADGKHGWWWTPVDDVMTKDPVVVHPSTPVAAAARILQRRRIHALPVVDGTALVGIITSHEIVDAFGHHLGTDIRGTEMTVALPDDLADLHRLTNALIALKAMLFPMALTIRLSKHERRARLIVGAPGPLRVAEELAAAGFQVSGLRVEPWIDEGPQA